jgi:hypothetical protein
LLWRFGGRISMKIGEPFVLERRVAPDGTKEPLEDVTTRLMLQIAELLPERHRGVYGPLLAPPGAGAASKRSTAEPSTAEPVTGD